MRVERKSPVEIQVTMEPYDANVIAYCLRHAADKDGGLRADERGRVMAGIAINLASQLKRAVDEKR